MGVTSLRGIGLNVKAPNGEAGRGSLLSGANGKDTFLRVPVGTVIKEIFRDNRIERHHEELDYWINMSKLMRRRQKELKKAERQFRDAQESRKMDRKAAFKAYKERVYDAEDIGPTLGWIKEQQEERKERWGKMRDDSHEFELTEFEEGADDDKPLELDAEELESLSDAYSQLFVAPQGGLLEVRKDVQLALNYTAIQLAWTKVTNLRRELQREPILFDTSSENSITNYLSNHSISQRDIRKKKDIKNDHDRKPILIARGGKGGNGNPTFMSTENRHPRYGTKGEPGESVTISMEMKLLADVGLVGFPNAGKR
jgi:GTPase involved in cell partitioning and DNA repair